VTEIGRSVPIPSFETADLLDLCSLAALHFQSLPIVLRLSTPICIVGDLHGRFQDLVRIIRGQGLSQTYLFLGDYVDRGEFSIETVSLVLTLVLKFPTQFWMIRGNHEVKDIASSYGFLEEVTGSYPVSVFDAFIEAFDWMPLAAIIAHRCFCVHGGIGPAFKTIEEIEALERPITNPLSDVVEQRLWGDPNEGIEGFHASGRRGRGRLYGPQAVQAFLSHNQLEMIIRAHECVDGVVTGKRMRVVTVFSASNYTADKPNRSGVVVMSHPGEIHGAWYDPLPKLGRKEAVFFSVTRRRSSDVGISLSGSWSLLAVVNRHPALPQRRRRAASSLTAGSGVRASSSNFRVGSVLPLLETFSNSQPQSART
jgi:hypothetical protein